MTDEDAPLMFVPQTPEEAAERLRSHVEEYVLTHLEVPALISVSWDVLVLAADSSSVTMHNDVLYFEGVPLRFAADAEASVVSSPLQASQDVMTTTPELLSDDEDENN